MPLLMIVLELAELIYSAESLVVVVIAGILEY
jgi:hypothetical protein